MGIDPATQGYARHANTHRTRTIDYAIVLDGEIDMLLDDSEIHVKAGDVLVQQATNHAWVNNGTKPCRIAFILIDGNTPHGLAAGLESVIFTIAYQSIFWNCSEILTVIGVTAHPLAKGGDHHHRHALLRERDLCAPNPIIPMRGAALARQWE